MRLAAMALLCGLLATPAAFADDSSAESDAQIFAAERNHKVQSLVQNYMGQAKVELEQGWSAPSHSGLLVTKVALTLDRSGKLSSKKIVSGSGSADEDTSVDKYLESFTFAQLPSDVSQLDLNLSFMSDGSVNVVKIVQDAPAATSSDEIPPVAPSIRPVVASQAMATQAAVAPVQPSAVTSAPPSPIAPAQATADSAGYMEGIEAKLKQTWFPPPRRKDNKRTVVRFSINRFGGVAHLRLEHSAGSPAADQCALGAVQSAAPFSPLPQGFPDELDAQVVFGGGVLKHDIHGTFISH